MIPTSLPQRPYQALLVLSFGGPEGPDDVIPFLENVLRGRNVPRERMLEVAEHYYHFGGVSPINQQNRTMVAALKELFAQEGPALPIYWGNRNWKPYLADTMRQMMADGIDRVLVYATSAFSSYSGCRQYREDIARAQAQIGEGAPECDKLRVFFNHPKFVEVMAERVREALSQIPEERRAAAPLVYTAHSIPMSMAQGSRYVVQLQEAIRLIDEAVGRSGSRLVYQSRSGPPTQPWLEPDILDHIRDLHATQALQDLVIVPVGFVSDHMEVLYDLDTEAKDLCAELGINMARAGTAGQHPLMVRLVRDLVLERMGQGERQALGVLGPNHDVCPLDCCPAPQRPPAARPTA